MVKSVIKCFYFSAAIRDPTFLLAFSFILLVLALTIGANFLNDNRSLN